MGTQLSLPKNGRSSPLFSAHVLWPNGWMDQDATWYGGRPRPRPHCVKWKPSSPPPKAAQHPHFSVHVYCGQMYKWIRTPLSMEVGLGPGHIVLHEDPAPSPKKEKPPILGLCLLWRNRWRDQTANWYGGRPRPRPHCVNLLPLKRSTSPTFRPMSKRSPNSGTAEHL